MQESIAALQFRVEARHPARHQVRTAHDMDRQAFGHGQHLVIGSQDATGEIPRGIQYGGPGGA